MKVKQLLGMICWYLIYPIALVVVTIGFALYGMWDITKFWFAPWTDDFPEEEQ